MKSSIVLTALAVASGLCAAQEVGRVISSTPVVQQVAVPRQVCGTDSVAVPTQRSGAGAALGALAGGAVGNAVGHGGGRALATMIGIFGGAVVGDRVEGTGATQYQNVQRCATQSTLENRVAYYSVVYEYAGRQYTAQMPNDPGPQVRLQVTPVDAAPVGAPLAPQSYVQPVETQTVYTQPVYAQPIYTQPVYTQPVYVQPAYPAVYPGYYGRPYYQPIGVNLQLGYGGGYGGGHHHGHWR